MVFVMNGGPASQLLAKIERSGRGSSAFWDLFWSVMELLTDEELRRVLVAIGGRAVPVQRAVAQALRERVVKLAPPTASRLRERRFPGQVAGAAETIRTATAEA